MTQGPDTHIAKSLLRVRLSQLIINEWYKKKAFDIPIHLGLGHEAIAVAVGRVMGKNDFLTPSHRNIHYNFARAGRLKPLMDEYLRKPHGLANGAQGSMNLANPAKNVVYTSSILGNNLGVAAGLALAQKVKKNAGAVFVITGDGAMEEGGFYESLEFAASNRLSVLYVIENNEWSLATRISERRCPIDVNHLAASFGAKCIQLRGNDVYAYIRKLRSAREAVLKKRQPVCVEVHMASLGGWYLKTPEHPQGRYVNYHAGPAPEVDLCEWPVLEHSNNDPVFVLKNHFPEKKLKNMAKTILKSLEREIK